MRRKTGTWSWAVETGGILSFGDHARLASQMVLAQYQLAASILQRAVGIRMPSVDVNMWRAMRPPDTRCAREAEKICRSVSSTSLLNHCLRTYYWGRILAAQEKTTLDDELFYVASLYHDFGLCASQRNAEFPEHCFTVHGAKEAHSFSQQHAWDETRSEALAEAITLHINVVVGKREGCAAHYLHEGASLDCTGMRAWEIVSAVRGDVIARNPVTDFKNEVDAAFQREKRSIPRGRVNFLYRYLAFGLMLKYSPIRDAPIPNHR